MTVSGLVTALLLLTARGLGRGVGGLDGVTGTEAVDASRDCGNSGLTVVPACAAAGGATALPTSSFPDLIRLVLSLSGSVDQRGAVMGSLLSAAAVTDAGGVPAPAATVASVAPIACSSSVPAPGASTPAGAASATASPGRRERAQECSRRRSSGQERSRLGGERVGSRSPSPARSTRSASMSASSSSESSDLEGRVSAMPPPPSSRPGAGGGCSGSDDRSASGRACPPQPGPSGLGLGVRAAPRADRSRSELCSRSSPAPSGAAIVLPVRSIWTGMTRSGLCFTSSGSSIASRNRQV